MHTDKQEGSRKEATSLIEVLARIKPLEEYLPEIDNNLLPLDAIDL